MGKGGGGRGRAAAAGGGAAVEAASVVGGRARVGRRNEILGGADRPGRPQVLAGRYVLHTTREPVFCLNVNLIERKGYQKGSHASQGGSREEGARGGGAVAGRPASEPARAKEGSGQRLVHSGTGGGRHGHRDKIAREGVLPRPAARLVEELARPPAVVRRGRYGNDVARLEVESAEQRPSGLIRVGMGEREESRARTLLGSSPCNRKAP